MICHPCSRQQHDSCRYPDNCPCQHVPADVADELIQRPETVILKEDQDG